jgi:riboflavin kinase/FMN adenylyltransferase
MRVFTDFNQAAESPFVLAAGVFDGVHVGHRAVLARASHAAREMGACMGVLTFFPHPAEVLKPGIMIPSLASREAKFELLAEQGAEFCIELPFTTELAALPPREFLKLIATRSRGFCKGIAAGRDWTFGLHRAGTMELIAELVSETGILSLPVDPVMLDGAPVSSTRIRRAVAEGRFADAARWLMRPYEIRGPVIRGAGIGARLGFPTANINYANAQLPPAGVYAVQARFPNGEFPALAGVANLGLRPTIDPGAPPRPVLEVYFPDFQGDLYEKQIALEFRRFLRPERRFPSLDQLRMQIALDVQAAAMQAAAT